jgi:hypothetical protein
MSDYRYNVRTLRPIKHSSYNPLKISKFLSETDIFCTDTTKFMQRHKSNNKHLDIKNIMELIKHKLNDILYKTQRIGILNDKIIEYYNERYKITEKHRIHSKKYKDKLKLRLKCKNYKNKFDIYEKNNDVASMPSIPSVLMERQLKILENKGLSLQLQSEKEKSKDTICKESLKLQDSYNITHNLTESQNSYNVLLKIYNDIMDVNIMDKDIMDVNIMDVDNSNIKLISDKLLELDCNNQTDTANADLTMNNYPNELECLDILENYIYTNTYEMSGNVDFTIPL